MALSMLARSSRAVTSVAAVRSVAPALTSVCHMSTLADRERAMEKAYFNKEEEKLLRSLLKKVKSQADHADTSEAAKETAETEVSALEAIVGKYNMSEGDKKALIVWRHRHEF